MAAGLAAYSNVDEKEYNRRIWAWTMYDWANSAFATTILAAVLPIYFSQVAGSMLSSAATATAYWSAGLSLSLLSVALLSSILGTVTDVMRGKVPFLSVTIWWAVFPIPFLLRIPEPPSATACLAPGESVLSVSFKRLVDTIKDIRPYRELFKYLLSLLIYNDGRRTILGLAAIYGSELGFGSIELILALLLVQFVGIPSSIIIARLPSRDTPFIAPQPGEHTLELVNSGQSSADSQGTELALVGLEVLPPHRLSNLGVISLLVIAVQLVGMLLDWFVRPRWFARQEDAALLEQA